jgi:hypothetical protein
VPDIVIPYGMENKLFYFLFFILSQRDPAGDGHTYAVQQTWAYSGWKAYFAAR